MLSRRVNRARAPRRAGNFEVLENRVLLAEIAGTLLVDVDATGLTLGTPANNITNNGMLGGVFRATGSATEVPVIGRPTANATSGTSGIRFDGNDFLQLFDPAANAGAGALVTAPAGITGPDPSASIEVWVWNPTIPGEETLVSWGRRNGPDGSNFSFNYGNDNRWGAMGHWGSPDAGWGPPDGVDKAPAQQLWHHLVYTYNDTDNTQRLYADGALVYAEPLAPGALAIWPDTPINLAAQVEPNPDTPDDPTDVRVTGALRGSLTIGKVRIHDGTLTDAQIATNYNTEKPSFVEPVIPPPEPSPAELLVSVDATTLPENTNLEEIPNTGPLGGVFRARGGGTSVPIVDTPIPDATSGTRGIVFDGDDYMQLVTGAGSDTLLTAPSTITGPDPASSVEVWVWNPSVPGEETLLSWGRRGGPDGSNYSFNYGVDSRWGAMGHWGAPDMGWTPQANNNAPSAQRWHHLVYTYDTLGVQRVYVDGVLWNSENLGLGSLNIHPNTPISLAAQVEPDNTTPDPNDTVVTGPLKGSLTLGKVNIYKGVLTPEQIATAHTTQRPNFVEPGVPADPVVKLVDVDATGLAAGTVTSVPNTGTLGGSFTPTGGAGTVPVIGPALTETGTPGTRGIRLDGTDYLQLTDAEGNPILSPPEITGVNPKISVDAWVFNPGVAREETILSWGRRGADGLNFSFNYGSDNTWGAVGRWGGADVGWSPTGGYPPAGTWHHVGYTFDGTTSRVYVDGALTNTEVPGEGTVNTSADWPITLGGQIDDITFPAVEEFLRVSMTIGRTRIYQGVRTDAEMAATYNAERAAFVNPTGPAPASLTSGPVHRYSFNNTAGAAASGTIVEDLVGDADGTVLGAGATFSGSRLVLPGGSSATAAYVDMPNGLVSKFGRFLPDGTTPNPTGTGQVTFEGWVKNTGNTNWTRYYDFGTGSAGEITGPGGSAGGVDYFMLTAQTDGGQIRRYEVRDSDDADDTGNMWHENTGVGNVDIHFVVTWDEVTGTFKYYENGKEVGGFSTPVLIGAMTDINNWLGRSQFTGDANLKGEYDEFRIYNRTLSAAEVVGNFQAGPNVLTNAAPQVAEIYVRGQSWAGDDGAATVTFGEFMQSSGLGHVTYGYKLPAVPTNADTVSWINADEIVLRYTAPVSGAGVPTAGQITVDGVRQDYTVTQVIPLDDRTFALRLDRPLGNIPGGGVDGDRIRLTVTGAGVGGTNFTQIINVLQGDANRDALGRVNAADQGYVKARVNRTSNNPGTPPQTLYTVFADVTADGRVNAADQGAVKSRINDGMPALPAGAGLFNDTSITEEILLA